MPIVRLEVPMELKSLKIGAKGEVEITFILQDFPIEDNKSIFGNEKGTGSVSGMLAYAKKHEHTFMGLIESIQPKDKNDKST